MGLCGPFGDDGPSGSSSGGGSGNPGSVEFGDATDIGAESGVMDAGADATSDGGVANGDACPTPVVCSAACVSGSHNVSTMVDGCLVTRCCVPDDAGADAATDGGSTDADACAPGGGCNAACVAGRHNVTVMVDGCLVTECCVLDDAGTD